MVVTSLLNVENPYLSYTTSFGSWRSFEVSWGIEDTGLGEVTLQG